MVVEGQMDDEEIEKFETGPDGAIIKVKRQDALVPVQNADLGSALNEAIETSADDLDRIAGVTPEDQGIPDRTTATQAQITANRAAVRGQKEQMKVVAWMAQIGREILLTARDKFILGIYALMASPEGENFLGTVQEDKQQFRYVTTEDLNDGYDFRINVDVTSLSATAQMDDKQKFIQFISVLQQFPAISMSPVLVREAAYRIGYRNMKAIKEFQKMALLTQMGHIQQLQMGLKMQGMQNAQLSAQMAPPGGNAAQTLTQQMQPPDVEAARNQIGSQPLINAMPVQ